MEKRITDLPENIGKSAQSPSKSYFNRRNFIIVFSLLLLMGIGGFFLIRYLVTDYLVYDRPLKNLTGHRGEISSISFSPDGQTLASGSHDKTVKLWDTASGNLKQTLTDHIDQVRSVSFSPDGKTLASGGEDETVILSNTENGEVKYTQTFDGTVLSIAFSPDGKTLAVGSDAIYLLDAESGNLRQAITTNNFLVLALAFAPDGKTFASFVRDELKLWDAANGNLIKTFAKSTDSARTLVFSPDGQTLAGGSLDGRLFLWDAASGNLKNTLVAGSGKVVIAFSLDGKTLFSGSYGVSPKTGDYEGEIKLWDAANGNFKRTFVTQRTSISSIALSPNGQTLTGGDRSGTINLWRAE